MKTLVAYFSAQGTTKRIAEKVQELLNCDIHEIKPETPYSGADLNWLDRNSRSSLEMKDPDCRPPLAQREIDVSAYDTVFVAYPIWWYREPSIIDSFLDACDLRDKKVILFATSGGSDIGDSAKRISDLYGLQITEARRLPSRIREDELKKWLDNLGL